MASQAGPADLEGATRPQGETTREPASNTRKPRRPRSEPPECVKALQRCAARLDEWERKQARLAREREHQTSPPDKPEPLLHRFITVPIVAIILSWVCIVYLWRIVYPALSGRANALATKGEGIGLCVGFCVLYIMTLWSWITAVAKQPGYAKDFLPAVDPPAPAHAGQGYPRRSLQEPILYNGPSEPRPAPEEGKAAGEHAESDPPGILSAALPIATAGGTSTVEENKGPSVDSAERIFGSSARSGAGTDTTAVSHSGHLGEKVLGQNGIALDKDVQEGSSSRPQSTRTRSASIASSLTGLPPSPRPHADAPPAPDAQEDGNDQVGAGLPEAGSQNQELRFSDESDAMPGGLPANAQEYNWEANASDTANRDAVQQFNLQAPPARPQYDPAPANSSSRGAPNPAGRPPFLPIPQRYPNVIPLLGSLDEVPSRYCHWCKIVKPPRAHHCKKCGACVLKMDHHCPWVGGCVGALNYRYFFIFVMWVSGLEMFVFVSNAVLFHRGVRRQGNPELPPEQAWSTDGFMISLFPICAIFSIFTVTLLSVHLYMVLFNLSTIEQLAYSSRTNGEDAVLDGWMRQPLEKRRQALQDFDRSGGWAMLVRNQKQGGSTSQSLPAPTVSSEATAAQHEAGREARAIAQMRKKAEEMLLVRADYVSCGLFLPHKAFLRQHFLDGGVWGAERTEGNAWWLGGSAEHGGAWERLCRLYDERDAERNSAATGAAAALNRTSDTAEGELCSKEAGASSSKRGKEASRRREREIARLERHIRGRPAPLGISLGAAKENFVQVFGTRPWEWFLPIGKPAGDGLSYPLNPRFASNGARRPRQQWPAALQ